MTADLGDPNFVYVAADTNTDMTSLWPQKKEPSNMSELWNRGGSFKLPTNEVSKRDRRGETTLLRS